MKCTLLLMKMIPMLVDLRSCCLHLRTQGRRWRGFRLGFRSRPVTIGRCFQTSRGFYLISVQVTPQSMPGKEVLSSTINCRAEVRRNRVPGLGDVTEVGFVEFVQRRWDADDHRVHVSMPRRLPSSNDSYWE